MRKYTYLTILISALLLGCDSPSHKTTYKSGLERNYNSNCLKKSSSIAGDYVTESYPLRDQGYDWMVVTVKEQKDTAINISIRSRADKKKPSCTFDATAFKVEDCLFHSEKDGKVIAFKFTKKGISIDALDDTGRQVLYYFCSGGGSIRGDYAYLGEPLDTYQLERRIFSKVLRFDDLGLTVDSKMEENGEVLHIAIVGRGANSFTYSQDMSGYKVVDAELSDLNTDGDPELYVYCSSKEKNAFARVFAFSIENTHELLPIQFSRDLNEQMGKGYRGEDQFYIVDNQLIRSFPVFLEMDSNDNPTGGEKQIIYHLTENSQGLKLTIKDTLD